MLASDSRDFRTSEFEMIDCNAGSLTSAPACSNRLRSASAVRDVAESGSMPCCWRTWLIGLCGAVAADTPGGSELGSFAGFSPVCAGAAPGGGTTNPPGIFYATFVIRTGPYFQAKSLSQSSENRGSLTYLNASRLTAWDSMGLMMSAGSRPLSERNENVSAVRATSTIPCSAADLSGF